MGLKPQSLKQLLKGKLTQKQLELLPRSFDTVGDILIFSDFPKELTKKQKLIGETLLTVHKNINVILKKIKKYSGTYRTPTLRIIAGARRKTTEHKENRVRLKLHVENVYFSTRSGNERKRISTLVKPNEDILVMFSGCAPYPCVIAKNTKAHHITGIEINPQAHKFASENIQLNKIKNVTLFNADVREIIPQLKKNKKLFDRIIMPLPKDAELFLQDALKVTKKGTIIHLYNFLHEDEFTPFKKHIKSLIPQKHKLIQLVKCGQYAPKTFRTCLDIKILE